jgi:AcrR family transcriptional regulator
VTAASRPRARKGEGDLLRQEILEATERLLIETGSEDAVSIRAVAAATGVTAPSIYRHFTDKTHLLFEVCARHFVAMDEAIQAAVADVDDPLLAMRERGRAYVRFGIDNPEHYRIMFMGPAYETPDQWDDLLGTGAFANLVDGIEALVDAGVVPAETDAFQAALHTWASIHGLTSLLVARPDMPWPELDPFIDHHLDLCLRALQAPGTDQPPR